MKECRAQDKNLLLGAVIRGTFNHFYKSLIILANPKTVVNDRYAKKEIKEQVHRADQLISIIKKMVSESKELSSSKKEMLGIAERLLNRNIDERKDYFAKYQDLIQLVESKSPSVEEIEAKEETSNKSETEEKKVCPRCGSELVLRTAKRGDNVGQKFYGCSNYPKCRYILNIIE